MHNLGTLLLGCGRGPACGWSARIINAGSVCAMPEAKSGSKSAEGDGGTGSECLRGDLPVHHWLQLVAKVVFLLL